MNDLVSECLIEYVNVTSTYLPDESQPAICVHTGCVPMSVPVGGGRVYVCGM